MAEAPDGRFRIAVADDNADVRRALKALLTALGHHVTGEAGNGAELIRVCAEAPVDLVIADFDMPVMDGLEAAEECAQLGLPVILLSGHAEIEQLNLEHEPIAVRLLKPATRENLTAAIDQAMRSTTR